MSTELVPFEQVKSMAAAVASSKLFKAFDTPEKAFVLMMVAQSEGCHPMQAVQRYDVIDGKPSKKSDAMLADFQARGGKVDWPKLNDKEVEGTFHAPGLVNPVTISWTIEMAKNAGLLNKNNWKGYPRAMMRARVISEGIRTAMPGVVAGLYTPEEVQDFDAVPGRQAQKEDRVVDATVASDPTPASDVPEIQVRGEPAKSDEPSTKASKEQITALCAVMTKIGIKARPEVLAWINERIAPRKVESRLDLTPDEALKCTDAAKTIENEQRKE